MSRSLILEGDDMLTLSRDFQADGLRAVYQANLRGNSMWPIIRSGDGIVVEQISEMAIRLQDVLVFSTGGEKLVAHRLVRVAEVGGQRRYVMHGDFRRYPDKPVAFESIVGKVIAIERRGKTIRSDSISQRLWVWLWPWLRPLPLMGLSIWGRLRRRNR